MIRLEALLGLVMLIVWLFAIFDSITAPAASIRGLQKPLWVTIVLLLGVFGSIAWFIWGRPRTGHPGARSAGPRGGRLRFPGPNAQPPQRPIAPDDDPDFLRNL